MPVNRALRAFRAVAEGKWNPMHYEQTRDQLKALKVPTFLDPILITGTASSSTNATKSEEKERIESLVDKSMDEVEGKVKENGEPEEDRLDIDRFLMVAVDEWVIEIELRMQAVKDLFIATVSPEEVHETPTASQPKLQTNDDSQLSSFSSLESRRTQSKQNMKSHTTLQGALTTAEFASLIHTINSKVSIESVLRMYRKALVGSRFMEQLQKNVENKASSKVEKNVESIVSAAEGIQEIRWEILVAVLHEVSYHKPWIKIYIYPPFLSTFLV